MLFRSGTGGTGAAPQPEPETATGTVSPTETIERDIEKVIADAVALGYSVVGDNLAHGRSVATRLSQGSYRLNHVTDDVGSAGQRLLKLAGDLGTVWIDLIGAVARDPDLHAALRKQHPHGSPVATLAWTFSTDARNHPRVTVHPLSLDMSGNPRGLSCAPLVAHSGGGAPITRVEWSVSIDTREVTAIIHVPANQAAGHYVGAVKTVPGGKVVGTLSLEVRA